MIRLPYKDPEKAKQHNTEYHRGWRKDNPDKVLENARRWRKNNPEKLKESNERYRAEHKEEIRLRQRIYNVKNPDKRRETCRKSGLKRRHIMKKFFVDMLGGKCEICGYNKCLAALEFHHLNPEEKENQFEYRCKGFIIKIKEGKIQLLCCRCHREITWSEIYGLLDME